jgi:predicted PurR-regulated permease PerM
MTQAGTGSPGRETSERTLVTAGTRPERPGSWGVPGWLRKVGLASWLLLGITGAVALAGLVFAVTRGVTIPLVVAVIAGTIFVPWVDALGKLGIPRWIGSLAVLLLVLGIAMGTVALVVWGIVNEASEIAREIESAIARIGTWLAEAGLDEDLPSRIRGQVASSGDFLGGGAADVVVGGLASAASFLVGGFLALNILLFVLKDAHTISAWMRARASGVVATTLLSDSARSLRAYFRGKTIVGAASALTVYVGALVLGVPLAASIGLVTFFTSYIPYLGALIAGAFALLLALGEGGIPLALGILAFVVLANAVIENLVTPFAIGSSLQLHPLVILVATILGGIVAGFVGIILAAPVTAIGVQVVAKLRSAGAFEDAPEVSPQMDPRLESSS